jgi:hypothetical protein
MLPEQDTCNHEPGNHKEDVHAHIAAAETRDVSVKQHDESDRHSSQTLDVGTKLPILGCGTRFVTRGLAYEVRRRRCVANYHLGVEVVS